MSELKMTTITYKCNMCNEKYNEKIENDLIESWGTNDVTTVAKINFSISIPYDNDPDGTKHICDSCKVWLMKRTLLKFCQRGNITNEYGE